MGACQPPDIEIDGGHGAPRRRRPGAVAAMTRARQRRMDERNTMKVTDLKARIARAEYDVDAHAVADAFVRRMLAMHGAVRRADVRELLGGAFDEIRQSA
jgi:hypothetical protein